MILIIIQEKISQYALGQSCHGGLQFDHNDHHQIIPFG